MIPVIVYLHAHDSGRYLEPYGYPVSTPNLLAFADDGVMFRNAFAAAPGCSPSRSALLTSMPPHVNGVIGLAHRGFPLIARDKHVANLLQQRGYRTVICGMQHVWEGDQGEVGYTHDIRTGHYNVADVLPNAIAALEEAVAANQPIFLDCGFEEAHRPFHTADAREASHVKPPFQYPDTPQTRQDIADFRASIRVFDSAAGELVAALKRLGVYDDALIVVTTDHGIPFPAMKCSLNVYGTGVFLMMRGPQGSPFRGGQAIDALVSHMDVLPTLWELSGWDVPDWYYGTSLIPLLQGAERIRDAIYGEITFHATWEPTRSIRTQEWLLIEHFGGPARRAMVNVDEGPTRDALLAEGWPFDHVFPEVELYDLVQDPAEQHNVAHAGYAQEARAWLLENLHGWMEQTDDPLITGDWPIAESWQMNRLDDLSAGDPLVHPTAQLDFTTNPVTRIG